MHGLPGSGKSKVLEWLRNYFETVWKWTLGHEFVFLAPLNSMASNIGGFTHHSWGEVPFKDARGSMICSSSRVEDDFHSSMLSKCGTLRFICIDEVEATGAETTGRLEGNVRKHFGAQNLFRYINAGKDQQVRMFGGVNTLSFWRLVAAPTYRTNCFDV